MKKIIVVLLCLAMLVSLTSFVSADDKVTITVYHYMGQATKQAGLNALQVAYSEAHPNVEFKNVYYNQGTDYWPQLTTALSTGDQPQIIMGNPSLYPDLLSEGYLYDLTDNEAIKALNLDLSDLAGASANGRVYGFPIDWKTWGIFYNKDKFEELDLKIPTTQTELIELQKAIIAAGYDPYVELFADLVSASINTRTAIWKYAIEAEDKDFMVKLAVGEINLTTDIDYYRKAFEGFETRLRNSKARPDDMSNTQDMALEVFTTGGALMCHTGSWAIGDMLAKEPDFTIGFFAVPVDDSGLNPIPLMVDQCFMINQKAEHVDVAIDFMEYWMSEGVAWSEVSQMPLLSGQTSNKLNDVVKDLCAIKTNGSTSSSGYFTSFYPNAIVTIGREEGVAFAENILHGDGTMTVDDVLNSIQTRIDGWIALQ